MEKEEQQQQQQQQQEQTEEQKSTNVEHDVIEIDLENRDPNNLNSHVRSSFEEVIGEPDGAHSADCVWTNAFKCFHTGLNLCYKILTFVCAIPLAFCWGCEFACMTFAHIWAVTPCFKIFNSNLACCAKFLSTIVHCCCDPCYEAMAIMFTQIYVHTLASNEEYKSKLLS